MLCPGSFTHSAKLLSCPWEQRTHGVSCRCLESRQQLSFKTPMAAQGWRRNHIFWKFEGPVLNCRGGTHSCEYLNELVNVEIRNNASAIFQKFLFSCCKIEFVRCGKNPLKPPPSVGWPLYPQHHGGNGHSHLYR